MIQLFKAELITARRAKSTQDYYDFKTAQLAHHLGKDTPIADIQVPQTTAYLTTRRTQVSDRTITKEFACLLAVLGLAKHLKLYAGDPKDVLPRKFSATYKPRTRHLARHEVDALLEALERWPHRAAWVAFAVATGARLSEVNAARKGDIDWRRKSVRIRGTKTEKAAREVPVISITEDLLRFAEKHGGGVDGALFVPWATSNVSQTLMRACERARIPRVSANDLRRTFASWLVQAGASTAIVGQVMGHTSSAMVERVYGRVTLESVRQLIEQAVKASKTDV
jgi:integrase